MAPARTVVSVSVAFVRHSEVKRVRPDRHAPQRGGYGSVVNEELIGHHLELPVSSDAEVRSADSDDRTVCYIGETFDYETRSGHLGQPVIVSALAPIVGILFVGEREHGDLVAPSVQVLHGGIVGVFVRDEECAADLAPVRIDTGAAENVLVQIDVVDVHGTVEGDGYHLGYVAGFQGTGNTGTVRRTEAIRKDALGRVAVGGAIRVRFDG